MLQIITNAYDSPNGTYFRTSSAEPELEIVPMDGQVLKLVNGTGTRRSSWGQPGVKSTVIVRADDLVAIHVGFFHKHGGGQFWRYYLDNGKEWQQVRWAQLSDENRVRILNAYENAAPSWAKAPGKLRTSYAKPNAPTYITYKIVEAVDGKFFSVYDGKTEYTLDKRLAERAVSEHGGGYYSYPSVDGVEASFERGSLFPSRCYDEPMELAVIECEISGTVINYDGRKFASTYLKPVKVLKQFSYIPKLQEVS